MGTYEDDHVFHIVAIKLGIKSFLSFRYQPPVIKTTNNEVATYFWKVKIIHLVMFWKIAQSYVGVSLISS